MDTQCNFTLPTLSHFSKTLAFILLFLLNGKLIAADKGVLLDELYDNAQLEQQLGWVLSSMTIDQKQYTLPPEVVNTVNQVVKVRYSPGLFKSSMEATLDEALSVGELLKLLDWYNSSLGQKILRLEMEANDPRNALRMQAYIEDKLSRELPRTSRIRLIEELMETLDAVELGTELAASASVGAKRILHEVMPINDGRPLRPPEVLKAREKPVIRKGMNDHMRYVYLYTYRSLPDNEIRAYLNFARSTAMQNFQRGQIQAIARIL
ncbi:MULTISPECIES: DUF2059 domain-containing protein [unclassified Endozoicomonas]|uniref:DUF2059 domain-containing protein n=1 Tax=unclassified Endozoicomonas TaxID=2644528 RepID=UPI0021495C5A|nr:MULTISPECIES: DUF2059 domain-containing protein [unclassified Endozoicomonas]